MDRVVRLLLLVGFYIGAVWAHEAWAFCSNILGYSTLGGGSTTSARIQAQRVVTNSSGTIDSGDLYSNVWTSGDKFMIGIYDDLAGVPNNLLAVSASVSFTLTNFNAVALSGPSFSSGVTYWIAFQTSASNDGFIFDTTGVLYTKTNTYGTFPNPFGTPTGGPFTQNNSFYVTYCTAGGNQQMMMGVGP